MIFGNFYSEFRKILPQLLCKIPADRYFRMEMTCLDEVQSAIIGIPENIVFDVGGDKGITPGIQRFPEEITAGAAAYGYLLHRSAAGYITQPGTAQRSFYMGKKCFQILPRDCTCSEKTVRPAKSVGAFGIYHLNIL